MPRNFKRLVGSCRRAVAIAKQPLGQRSKGQKCGARVLAETRSERTMLDGVIKRDCSIEVIDCSVEMIATLDKIAGKKLSEPILLAVWEQNGQKRILDKTLNLHDQLLLLIGTESVTVEQLDDWTVYYKPQYLHDVEHT